MNKEDIIRMAREAGLAHFYDSEGHCTGITDARLITENKERNDDRLVEMLAPFAALVAAAEQKKWEEQTPIEINEAVLEEREACAKVCEAYTDNDGNTFIDHEGHGYECAAAIRARSNNAN